MDDLGRVRGALERHDWQGALHAAEAASPESPQEAAELAYLAADAAWWLGRLDDCIDARERAYLAYEELGDHRRAGASAVWLFEHHAMTAHPAMAGGWLRRARRALGDDDGCVEHGYLLLREAEAAHGAGDLELAAARAAAAIELGRALRSTDLEADALQARGRVLVDGEDVADGMGHLDEAMLFAVEGRLGPYATGKVYCSLISACEAIGDMDRAAEWTEATMDWAQQHPLAIFPGICRVHRAVVLKRRGSLAEAELEAAHACEELGRSHVGNSAAAYAEVGDICRRLGELDRSEEAFVRAQELCGRPCSGLALLRLAQGRADAAMAIVQGCLDGTTAPLGRAGMLPTYVHVALAAGDEAAATAALAELDEAVHTYGTPELRAALLSTRGRVELARGASAPSVATLREATAAWLALDVPYEVATARTLLGQALRDEGDAAGAAEAFAAAAEQFEQIGAVLDARDALGDTRAAPPAGLTEREVEVLRLVSAGLTNAEIAERLFLSAKTVSRHLSNIFTKIDVSSRAAATAFAFEHELVETRG